MPESQPNTPEQTDPTLQGVVEYEAGLAMKALVTAMDITLRLARIPMSGVAHVALAGAQILSRSENVDEHPTY